MDNPEFSAPDAPQVDEDSFSPRNGRFPSPTAPEPPQKKRGGCWITGLALLVILSLTASALLNLFWAGGEVAANWSPPWVTPTPSLANAGRIAYIGAKGQVFTVQPEASINHIAPYGAFVTHTPVNGTPI